MLNLRKIIMIALLFIIGSFNLVYAYSDEEKATTFNRVMETPIWFEQTITVRDGDLEKARKLARLLSPNQVRQQFRERIVQTEELGLTRDMIDFSGLITIVEEDTSGNYGRPFVIEESGKEIERVTFRFKMQCERINEINPFIKKAPYQKSATINYVTEYDDYWEIQAVGYGYYESFEDIDSKVAASALKAKESAKKEIMEKVRELGLLERYGVDKIDNDIHNTVRYGGVYSVLGCGVEIKVPMTVKIYK